MSELFTLTNDKPGHAASAKRADISSKSIAMSSLKMSLKSSAESAGSEANIEKLLKNDKSLLNLFIAMQQLIGSSSLDNGIDVPGLRYDHNTD